MRLHKECFDALMQHRIVNITSSHTNMDSALMTTVKMLRKDPSPIALNAVIDATSFKTLVGKLLHYVPDTEIAMTVAYLKDVSSLLELLYL